MLWAALLLVAVLALAGATWRLWVFNTVTAPAFGSLGLTVANADSPHWKVKATSDAARKAHVGIAEVILEVNRKPIDRSLGAQAIVPLIRGSAGAPVIVKLWQPKTKSAPRIKAREVTLAVSAKNSGQSLREQVRWFKIFSHAVDLLAAALLIAVAFLLWRCRKTDPVAHILSYALLLMAAVGCTRLWEWLRFEEIEKGRQVACLSLLLIALPALPSGRYVPSWSRWFMLLGPTAALLLVVNKDNSFGTAVMAGTALAVIASITLRFVETPPGAERQQMKWAVLGFGAGTLLWLLGDEIAGFLPAELQFMKRYLSFALTRGGLVMMPLGLLFSLLGYRLNDVDKYVGRSTRYAVVTTLIGVVAAVGTHQVNAGIKDFTTHNPNQFVMEHGETLAILFSSLVAIALIAPATKWITSWTEQRFEGPLLRMRALPSRIARWEDDDDPQLVARRALTFVVEGVGAVSALLLRERESGPPEILAAQGLDDETASRYRSATEATGAIAKSADPFPIRVQAGAHAGQPLILLVGRRNDGASYTRAERAAVAAVAEPLADVLRVVTCRHRRSQSIAEGMAEIKRLLLTHGVDAGNPA